MSWITLRNWLKPKSRRRDATTVRSARRIRRLQAEHLEDRTTPTVLDLTAAGASGSVNGALFHQFGADVAGTGLIDSFVRLQATGTEQGFNTDIRPVQFDEKTDGNFTRALLLSDVPTVSENGILYREFVLDINETGANPFLSLDQLRLFISTSGTIGSPAFDIVTGQLAGATQVYNLDAGGDNWVRLNYDLASGSGRTDMLVLIPDEAFASTGTQYVYLYSQFGTNEASDDGFEEWSVGTNGPLEGGVEILTQIVDLSITKDDGQTSAAPGETLTYTIVVTNNGPFTATGATVQDTFSSLLTDVSYTSVITGTGSSAAPSGMNVTGINDTVTLTTGSSITYTVTGTVAANATVEQLSDFSTLGANDTALPQNITVNGVRADAFYLDGTSYQTTDTTLYLRNETNDHGLGVLSNGENASLGGDANELSNQINLEVIRLQKAADEKWTSLWVSSLDGNGSGDYELGTLYWSNSPTPDLSTLGASSFTFKFGDFGGSVEGDLLALNPAGFDATATYLFFRAGPNPIGTDNDYLVWKATTATSLLTNKARVIAPTGVPDTNPENNCDTDTDTIGFGITISGQKFNDLDGNGVKGNCEPGLQGWTIFLDTDHDGVLDSGEMRTTTDANGHYIFANLAPGTYRVREVQQDGFMRTTCNPADIAVVSGSNISGVLFGNFQMIEICGTKFRDANGNGIRDAGERGMRNWVIYIDANGNGRLDKCEKRTRTDASGHYCFVNLGPGTYRVREVGQLGWIRMTDNPLEIVATSGGNRCEVDFGNMPAVGVGGVSGGGGGGGSGGVGGVGSGAGKLFLIGGNAASLQNGVFARRVQWVAGLYESVLGHAPDLAGLAHYVRLLQAGFTRAQVTAIFMQDHA